MEHLIFRLYGPMVAWGDTAVGETRPSAPWPSRSALIGLLAAALGICRNQESKLGQLSQSIATAVCVRSAGDLLRDYHTTQVPPAQRGVRHLTRRDELGSAKLHTILSQRDYRTDALYLVALWNTPITTESYTLPALAEALLKPGFPLYLGRKSCPPALPLCPELVVAETLHKAFAGYAFRKDELLKILTHNQQQIYAWEEHPAPGIAAHHRTRRRDQPWNRKRWQFKEREEFVASETEEK